MSREIVRTYATTAGKEGHAYFLLDEKVAGKSGVANSEVHKLPLGHRYIVSIRVSSKGMRRIIAYNEVEASAGGLKTAAVGNDHIYVPLPEYAKYYPVPKGDPHYWIADETQQTLMSIIRAYKGKNANVFLIGPQGVGKTSLAEQIASMIGFNYFEFQVPQVRDPMDWIGRLMPSQGTLEFRENLLVAAISTPRTIVCLNEFNRVEANLHNAVYDLLSDRRQAYYDEMGKTVVVANDVHFFITMNMQHVNVGTFLLDQAMMDRANAVLTIGFMPYEKEKEVLRAKTGADEEAIGKIVAIGDILRTQWDDGKIPFAPSFRWLESACRLSTTGMKMKAIFEHVFTERYSPEGGASSDRAFVKAAVLGKVSM